MFPSPSGYQDSQTSAWPVLITTTTTSRDSQTNVMGNALRPLWGFEYLDDPPEVSFSLAIRRPLLLRLPPPRKRVKAPVPKPERREAKRPSLLEHRQWMLPAVASSLRTKCRRPTRVAYWKR